MWRSRRGTVYVICWRTLIEQLALAASLIGLVSTLFWER